MTILTIEEQRLELFDFQLKLLTDDGISLDTASGIARGKIDGMTDGEIEDVYAEVMYGDDE
jgi:hypothetical protein